MEGTVFKIICFIKHVWETWNYTVGAFVATSYFLSRIPDLCLHAAPLYLSPNRILGPLVYIWKLSHLDSAYPLSFRWLKIVHFAMPWLKTKTAWDSEGFWPLAGAQASYWGCRVGVGVKFSSSSLHCECPVTPPITTHHTWVSRNIILCLSKFWRSKCMIMATIPFSYLPWLTTLVCLGF